MSTKAKTTRLTFGDRAAAPGSAGTDAAPPDASSADAAPAAASPAAASKVEGTPAEARRGAPGDLPGRSEPVEQPPGEIGGSDRPEPTRYGDWEVGGRCTDF